MADGPSPRDRTKQWRTLFIEALRHTGVVSAAAKAAGVSRKTAYKHYKRSKLFREQWEEARDEAADAIEAAAFKRAREGWIEPYDAKHPKRHRRSYPPSDMMQKFLLQSLKPEVYGKKLELTGGAGSQVKMDEKDQAILKQLSADPEAMAAMKVLAERRQAIEHGTPEAKPAGNGKVTMH